MQLHPRSFLPLANLLECEKCQESIPDRILYKLYHTEHKNLKGSLHTVDSSDFDLEASRPEWILALVQVGGIFDDYDSVSGESSEKRIVSKER